MILLLHGEDTYQAKVKLTAIRQKFLSKHPVDNLAMLLGTDLTGYNLRSVLLAQTLLGGPRLVILSDTLSGASAEVKTALVNLLKSGLPEEVTAIFYETQPFDKRQSLFKLLNQPKQAEEFIPLGGVALRRVVQGLAQKRGVAINPAVLECLLTKTGGNLWRVENELNKLFAYADGQPVTQATVDLLVTDSLETNIFALVTSALGRDLNSAHRIVATSLLAGEDETRLMGAIAYQLRNLIRISDLKTAGVQMSDGARLTQLPPFVVRANWQITARFQRSQLVRAYQRLAHFDWQIKIGAYDPSDALDLFTLTLATT
ncbi:DNA polymerase III subunit delta [candidate division Kazan bacterium RIFCSPHIGHO2_01_FULL_44_14]|uniref:DNA-directed DNA polymerase n=1 Tax=candidate division Kazan bacterium RIFCSPLOWO2_01_FULL_45_19 TaxID=1798538 RepID=A0A1F4NQ57_UNCK3|nr:hypothetical protein [uncultured bacterium]AQS31010.1 hypothetical protein [uncultured bacterium]OGB73589.1 MAG: DNA polymerase III subunit delta [candidate division Kazan bacterium RIFCSPLOWO2_01_FULL_45_19]OGB77834.1 MAG: DNA polymerase III subunit delta [candidate division Kazan bacterium RIFCSPHIGHO2_01_FULL_44_14]